MKILGIVGSAAKNSSNRKMLEAIKSLVKDQTDVVINDDLRNFPLFTPEALSRDLPQSIVQFKHQITSSDAVIIVTPEYTHNIPAVLKNALEWITASEELSTQKVLPITFTPHEPRGKYAMESLCNSLVTMDARIVSQLPLYRNEVEETKDTIQLNEEYCVLIREAITLLK